GGLLLYCAAVWYDWLPWLHGWHNYPDGWSWPLFDLPPAQRFVPVVGIMGAVWLLVLATEWARRAGWFSATVARKRTLGRLFLGLMVLMGYGLQVSLLGLKADNAYGLLLQRIASRHFTSYFSFAADAPDLDTLFGGY